MNDLAIWQKIMVGIAIFTSLFGFILEEGVVVVWFFWIAMFIYLNLVGWW